MSHDFDDDVYPHDLHPADVGHRQQRSQPHDVPDARGSGRRQPNRPGGTPSSGGHVARALARMNVQEGNETSGTQRRASSSPRTEGQFFPREVHWPSPGSAGSSPQTGPQPPAPGGHAAANPAEGNQASDTQRRASSSPRTEGQFFPREVHWPSPGSAGSSPQTGPQPPAPGGHAAANPAEGHQASDTQRDASSSQRTEGQFFPREVHWPSPGSAGSSPQTGPQPSAPGGHAAANPAEQGDADEQDMTATTLADTISEVTLDLDAGRLPPDSAGEPYRWVREAAGERERGLRMEAAALTLAASRSGGYSLKGKRITLYGVADMVSETRVVHAQEIPPSTGAARATVTAWQKHPPGQAIRVAAIRAMSLQICLVNDASAYQLGGGFIKGERHGLEESLCMQSTLFPSLLVAKEMAAHHPLSAHSQGGEGGRERYIPEGGVILSPSVELIRGDSSEGYPFEGKPVCLAAVLSIAMPNNNPQLGHAPVDRPQGMQAYRDLLRQKFIALLGAAKFVGAAGVVVPDVGCGAYLNRPAEVGRTLGEVVQERFPGVFKEIHLVGGTEFCDAAEAAGTKQQGDVQGGNDISSSPAVTRAVQAAVQETVQAAMQEIPVTESDQNPATSPASSSGSRLLPDAGQIPSSEEPQPREHADAFALPPPADAAYSAVPAGPGNFAGAALGGGEGGGAVAAASADAAITAAAGVAPDAADGTAASIMLSPPGRAMQQPPGGAPPFHEQHVPVAQHSLQGVQTIDLFGEVVAEPGQGPNTPHSGPAPVQQGHSMGGNSFVDAGGNQSWAGPSLQPEPLRGQVMFRDPRPGRPAGSTVGIVAFSKGERVEPWDKQCGASFLGNYYDLGPGGLRILVHSDSWFACCACCEEMEHFRNAEAAFEALKFWRAGRANEFENLTGRQASDRSEQGAQTQDRNLAGFSHVFVAMMHVLRSKFFRGSPLAMALLKTEPDFLLYHDSLKGEDPVWSDDFDGTGTNWLGMQLMLIREELRMHPDDTSTGEWTSFVEGCMDTRTGAPLTARGAKTWQDAVQSAALAVRQAQVPVIQPAAMLPLPAVGLQSLTSFCEGLSCKKGEVCNLQ